MALSFREAPRTVEYTSWRCDRDAIDDRLQRSQNVTASLGDCLLVATRSRFPANPDLGRGYAAFVSAGWLQLPSTFSVRPARSPILSLACCQPRRKRTQLISEARVSDLFREIPHGPLCALRGLNSFVKSFETIQFDRVCPRLPFSKGTK